MNELLLEPGSAAARDLSGRSGFDVNFLGLPVPVPPLAGVETVQLPYTHFSVLMRLYKRLAAVTALCIDGEKLVDLVRSGIRENDPVYRGVDIPLLFFKVAVFVQDGELAATGYVVDQTPQLADLPDVPRPGSADEAPRWVRSGPSKYPSATSEY